MTASHPEFDMYAGPQAVNHAFSQYALAFDEFSEPRTIPAGWDMTELLAPPKPSRNEHGEQPESSALAPGPGK